MQTNQLEQGENKQFDRLITHESHERRQYENENAAMQEIW